jgi:hypothetical protein
MPNGPSIFAYLVFGPGGTSVEGIARPMKLIVWRGPGARLGVQRRTRRTRPSQIRTCLGFIRTASICNWLGEQSRDPTFAYKRLGWRSRNLSRHFFTTIHLSACNFESSPPLARSNLRPRCNTSIVATPSIKSDKQDVGRYPSRGPNLGITRVFCVV